MIRQHHHIIPNILHFLAGGGMSLAIASLAVQFGMRSADRMPGESRRPHCVFCLAPLTWQDVVPLFGWLLRPDTLALPCPCGKRRGLWPQPAAEFIGFLLGAAAMYLVGWNPLAMPLCLGLGLLPAIALVDLHFGVMPDGLSLLLALLGLLWVAMGGGDIYVALMISASLLAVGLFCALIYSRWRGKEMLGIGDVKFFAAAGLWLQLPTAPWFLGIAGLIGIVSSLLWQRLGGGKESPFAPALCLSLAGCVLWQVAMM